MEMTFTVISLTSQKIKVGQGSIYIQKYVDLDKESKTAEKQLSLRNTDHCQNCKNRVANCQVNFN